MKLCKEDLGLILISFVACGLLTSCIATSPLDYLGGAVLACIISYLLIDFSDHQDDNGF